MRGRKMVGVTGFEPATPASRTQYSTRLSYTPNRDRRLTESYEWRVTEKDANSSKESLYFEAASGASALHAAFASRTATSRA